MIWRIDIVLNDYLMHYIFMYWKLDSELINGCDFVLEKESKFKVCFVWRIKFAILWAKCCLPLNDMTFYFVAFPIFFQFFANLFSFKN
jgi:hypothetical protein